MLPMLRKVLPLPANDPTVMANPLPTDTAVRKKSIAERIRGFQYGPKAADDPTSRIPDSWEEGADVTESDVERQLNDRGEPPPKILTRFAKNVIAVYAQPSDDLLTYTYPLTGGQNPIQIVNAQPAGVGCQVTLINYGDGAGAGDILIAPDASQLTPSTSGNHQSSAIKLEGPATGIQSLPFVLTTRAELYAICINAVTAYLGVIVETYDPDSHTWEPWQAGRP